MESFTVGEEITFQVAMPDGKAPVASGSRTTTATAPAKPERTFKVTLTQVNLVDLSQIQEYCEGRAQAAEVQELCLLAIQCVVSGAFSTSGALLAD